MQERVRPSQVQIRDNKLAQVLLQMPLKTLPLSGPMFLKSFL